MDFSKFFGGSNSSSTPAQSAQQQQPTGQASASEEGTDPNAEQQQQQQAPNNNNNQEVDIYADLFDNTGDDSSDLPPAFNLEPDAITKAAESINFTNGITEQDIQTMQSGDPEAILRVLSRVGQNAYANALNHTTKLTDKFVTSRSEYERNNVNGLVKEQLALSELGNADTPKALKGELTRATTALRKKYPDAPPKWIAEQAQEYIVYQMAGLVGMDLNSFKQMMASNQQAAQQQAQRQKSHPDSIDWSQELPE